MISVDEFFLEVNQSKRDTVTSLLINHHWWLITKLSVSIWNFQMVTHNQARFFLRFTPNFLKTFWIEEYLTLKVILVCSLPVSKIDVFSDPRSHGGAVKYFSKIQKTFIQHSLLFPLGFRHNFLIRGRLKSYLWSFEISKLLVYYITNISVKIKSSEMC